MSTIRDAPLPKDSHGALAELFKRSDLMWQDIYGNIFWKQKLIDMPVGAGAYTPFDQDMFEKRMAASDKANGFAIPMYWTSVQKLCLGYSMSVLEIEAHSSTHYDAMACAEKCEPLEWQKPIVIGCTDKKTPGDKGHWRRLSGDRDVFAVLWQLVYVHGITASNAKCKEQVVKAKSMLMDLICHMPVEFVYIADGHNDAERAFFKHSYQLRESLLITAENENPSAWETFCNYAEIKKQNQSCNGDTTDEAVDKFFKDEIVHSQAATQERKGISAMTCLKAYEKLLESNVSHLCAAAKALHGLKSPLTQISKLIMICQKCGADPKRVAFAISYFHVRLLNGTFSGTMSKAEVKSMVPHVLMAYEIQCVIVEKVLKYENTKTYDSKLDTEWTQHCAIDPIWVVERNTAIENHTDTDFLHLSQSCQWFFRWCSDGLTGAHDRIWSEVTANYGAKAWRTQTERQNTRS